MKCIVMLLFSCILLFGCTQNPNNANNYVCADGSIAADSSKCPAATLSASPSEKAAISPTPGISPSIQPRADGCIQTNFTMAFILAAQTPAELTKERIEKLNSIKSEFSGVFNSATLGMASMDTSYPVFAISREELPKFNYESITKKFYEANPDDFDFISIYAVNGSGSNLPTSHETAQNKIKGIGIPLYERTSFFGSKGRLLGVTYERDIDILSGTGNLLHETGHQWCCFVGKDFNPDNLSEFGILQEGMHFYKGLGTPYDCNDPMGAGYWISNGDGTYARFKNGANEKFHPFALYLMGVINAGNFDFGKKFNIYYAKLDMETASKPVKQVSINDIILEEGPRSCASGDEIAAASETLSGEGKVINPN